MGACISTVNQDYARKRRSDEINRRLKEDARRMNSECRMLLLGLSGSGKSTILKQLKIVYEGGFSETELMEFKRTIHRNILDAATRVVEYMNNLGLESVQYSNRVLTNTILESYADAAAPVLSPEMAEAIHQLHKDPIFTKIMDEHSSDLNLMKSASYFFGEVLRIGEPRYLPNMTDVMRTKINRAGIAESRFTMGELPIHVFCLTPRSERRKFMHYFESVTSIMFCVALSDYTQVLLEDKSQNRLRGSVALFGAVLGSRWFTCTHIILLLNKIDVFLAMLSKVPLEHYFPDYPGGDHINQAGNWILRKFMEENRTRRSVYPHLTQATEATNIRLVFNAARESISRRARQTGALL